MANLNKSKTIINVGVDVGKHFLDICIHEKQLYWQEENTPEGIKRLLKRLSYYQVERLVMEATGRYEFELAQAAYNKGLPVLPNPYPYAAMPARSINSQKQTKSMPKLLRNLPR